MSETPRTDALKAMIGSMIADAWNDGWDAESHYGQEDCDQFALADDAIDEVCGAMESELSDARAEVELVKAERNAIGVRIRTEWMGKVREALAERDAARAEVERLRAERDAAIKTLGNHQPELCDQMQNEHTAFRKALAEIYYGASSGCGVRNHRTRSAIAVIANCALTEWRENWRKRNVPDERAEVERLRAPVSRDVFERQRDEITALKEKVLQRVILRIRGPAYYCAKCHKQITRHAAQTVDGNWHHLGCLTLAPSLHYQADDVRVIGECWQCGCGHHNGPNLSVCAACGRRPYERGV